MKKFVLIINSILAFIMSLFLVLAVILYIISPESRKILIPSAVVMSIALIIVIFNIFKCKRNQSIEDKAEATLKRHKIFFGDGFACKICGEKLIPCEKQEDLNIFPKPIIGAKNEPTESVFFCASCEKFFDEPGEKYEKTVHSSLEEPIKEFHFSKNGRKLIMYSIRPVDYP